MAVSPARRACGCSTPCDEDGIVDGRLSRVSKVPSVPQSGGRGTLVTGTRSRMSEKAQIAIAGAVMVLALVVMLMVNMESEVAAPASTPAPATTPSLQDARRALEQARAEDDQEHRALREEFAQARAATDWTAALDVAERGVTRFPDPSTEFGGHWLKQRNHLSRLLSVAD
jgi:hypothetical protein